MAGWKNWIAERDPKRDSLIRLLVRCEEMMIMIMIMMMMTTMMIMVMMTMMIMMVVMNRQNITSKLRK